MTGVYPLSGTVKHYDWGGFSFIPSILKTSNTENRPFAEYWMGTHPLGVAEVQMPAGLQLLSAYTGDLSYLLKVLDVRDMLSIQVHPSKAAAQAEFDRENNAGIPLDSPQRSYKDNNHKPELMAALSDFWLLHGFKPGEKLETTLSSIPALNNLLPVFRQSGYPGLYRFVMEMDQQEVDQWLQPHIDKILPLYKEGKLTKFQEDFWAARAALTYANGKHIDRGIFSIYFFNLVFLKKGEAIFQDAGVPHAYLEGQNVEIMANSDNVLRGGLTTKYIDVKELLKHVKCESLVPHILSCEPVSPGHCYYRIPVDDFRLDVLELPAGQSISLEASGTELLIITEGEVLMGENPVALRAGHPAAVAFDGTAYTITGIAPSSTVYRAGGSVMKVNK